MTPSDEVVVIWNQCMLFWASSTESNKKEVTRALNLNAPLLRYQSHGTRERWEKSLRETSRVVFSIQTSDTQVASCPASRLDQDLIFPDLSLVTGKREIPWEALLKHSFDGGPLSLVESRSDRQNLLFGLSPSLWVFIFFVTTNLVLRGRCGQVQGRSVALPCQPRPHDG